MLLSPQTQTNATVLYPMAALNPHAYGANAPSNDDEFITSRLPNIKNKKNELNDFGLREIKSSKRWTPQKRHEQSLRARDQKPWLRSTGPKTAAGKAKSSQNAAQKTAEMRDIVLYIKMSGHFNSYCLAKKRVDYYKVLYPNDDYKNVRAAMKLEQVLLKMRDVLTKAGIENPALDARILVRQGGRFSDVDMIVKSQTPLSDEVIEKIEQMAIRRAMGEPLSRLLGHREFWGMDFKISPDTLDPRPDTETLVEAVLKGLALSPLPQRGEGRGEGGDATTPSSPPVILNEPQATEGSHKILQDAQNDKIRPLKILDLGTGSGCILISLLKELPHATGVGVDINAGALVVSCENAKAHGVNDRAEFRCGSWFEAIKEGEQFDLIVSNPPYIPESHIESLAIEVREHDPILALSGGESGLEAYKIILKDLKKHLVCGGRALLEIGVGQEKDVARLVDESNMRMVESYRDLGGILRVLEITHGEN